MKTIIFLIVLFLYSAFYAQTVVQFNQSKSKVDQKLMLTLGTWSLANTAVGIYGWSKTEDESKYFHQMNAAWGGINLAIAGFGYYNSMSADPASFSLLESINEQHNIQKVLMLNIGLDAAYMLGGAYMIERSKTTIDNPERLSGFGKSVIMQGAFLCAFDIGFYIAHNLNNPKLEPLLSSLTFTGNGFHFVMNL